MGEHEHTFERFELTERVPVLGGPLFKVERTYYVGYLCTGCGEPGYPVR